MAEHKVNLSHDVVSDSLRQERFTPSDLWQIVKAHNDNSYILSLSRTIASMIRDVYTLLNW